MPKVVYAVPKLQSKKMLHGKQACSTAHVIVDGDSAHACYAPPPVKGMQAQGWTQLEVIDWISVLPSLAGKQTFTRSDNEIG